MLCELVRMVFACTGFACTGFACVVGSCVIGFHCELTRDSRALGARTGCACVASPYVIRVVHWGLEVTCWEVSCTSVGELLVFLLFTYSNPHFYIII